MGGFLLSVEENNAALAVLEEGRNRHPRHTPTIANLAVAYMRSDRPDKATQAFRRALMLTPDHPGVQFNFAKHLAACHQIDSAIELFHLVVAADPRNFDAWMALGALSFDLGELATALEQTHRAAALRPAESAPQHALLFMPLFSDELPWPTISKL